MSTLNFHLGFGLTWKFPRLALPRALTGVIAASEKRSSAVGPGTRPAARTQGARAKGGRPRSTKAQASASVAHAPDRGDRRASVILAAPFRMLARFLFSKITLQREGKSLNFKLMERAVDVPPPPPVDKALTDALPLRAALKTLLDSHPMTRRVMRHLAYVEGALATHGTKATMEVPIEALSIAVGQLEGLVSNWSNPALAELRSKLAVAIVDRSRDPFDGTDKLSNFFTESRLVIGEVSHSMFAELERQYEHVLPAPLIRAALDPVRSGLAVTSDRS